MAKSKTRKRRITNKRLEPIKLTFLICAETMQRLINYYKNSRPTGSMIKTALKDFLEAAKFDYKPDELDTLASKIRLILASMAIIYNKPINPTNKTIKQRGGSAYFGRLIDKGDKPITGDDFKKAVDDVAQLLSPMMFAPALTEDFGVFGVSTMLDILQGEDEESIKQYFKWHLMDRYASIYPPSIHMEKVWPVVETLQNYLNVYFTHKRIKNQALAEEGKVSEEDLKPSALEQLAQKVFDADMAMKMSIINPLSLRRFDPSVFVKANV